MLIKSAGLALNEAGTMVCGKGFSKRFDVYTFDRVISPPIIWSSGARYRVAARGLRRHDL